ncbi:hypothetical protein [Winogradskyella flava]|uniref:hypothetical protein n=1 Tax=Winogradskyella flava TaxID=1884876 RepID=UPI00249283BB|nr:hypothetical protein [Winogradskyella flava]
MRIFKEEQRFNQIWLILVIATSVLAAIGIIISAYVEDHNSLSAIELVAIIGLLVFASGFIFLFKLNTRIDENGISYKFFPFHWSCRQIQWNEINNAYVRTYDALGEYGGWGIKGGKIWNTSKGKAINVSGNIGIQFELNNGKKLLIGTQKKEDAEKVLATYKTKIDYNA